MKINIDGQNKTPNEFAKELIMERGFDGAMFWDEHYPEVFESCTDKQRKEIFRLIMKHGRRVKKFLNIKN